MEILDWIIIIGIVALLFYAKFNYTSQFNSAMSVVDSGVKAIFSLAGNLAQNVKSGSQGANNSTLPTPGGG